VNSKLNRLIAQVLQEWNNPCCDSADVIRVGVMRDRDTWLGHGGGWHFIGQSWPLDIISLGLEATLFSEILAHLG
jgi:hypothetical protein